MVQQKQSELESLLSSISELKIFLDSAKSELNLPKDSTVKDIFAAIQNLAEAHRHNLSQFDILKESLNYYNEIVPKLKGLEVSNQLNLNVAEFTLFELLSAIDNMLEVVASFDNSESAKEFLIVSLHGIKNLDIAEKQKSVEKLHEEIATLKAKLQDKIELSHTLKAMVSNIICDLEADSFDLSLDRCKTDLDKLKEDAMMFRMLVEQNYIKTEHVGDKINLVSNSNFNLNYDKE